MIAGDRVQRVVSDPGLRLEKSPESPPLHGRPRVDLSTIIPPGTIRRGIARSHQASVQPDALSRLPHASIRWSMHPCGLPRRRETPPHRSTRWRFTTGTAQACSPLPSARESGGASAPELRGLVAGTVRFRSGEIVRVPACDPDRGHALHHRQGLRVARSRRNHRGRSRCRRDCRHAFREPRERDKTFLVDLPSGVYDVTPTLGDAKVAEDRVALWIEGTRVASGLSISKGHSYQPTFRVQVSDGQLTLRLADQGGKTPCFAIAAPRSRRPRPR